MSKVMVKGDLEGQPIGTPVDLAAGVILYAPKGAEYHAEGQETTVAEGLADLFIAKGFTKTPPKAK